MSTKLLARIIPAALFLVAACGPVNGNRENGDEPGAVSPSSELDPSAVCGGAYWCTDNHAHGGPTTIDARDGGCWMRNTRVDAIGGENVGAEAAAAAPDGGVYFDDAGIHLESWVEGWTGPGSTFDICSQDNGLKSCWTCHPYDAPDAPAPSPSGARCAGRASPCESFVPGGCSVQPGCYMHSEPQWDGTFQNSCAGSPRSCSSASDRTACAAIRGCSWN
jgi:hypothetical protein